MQTLYRSTAALLLVIMAVTVKAQDAAQDSTQDLGPGTDQELASYAAGVQIAYSIMHQAEQLEMDPASVAAAIEDVLSGRDLRFPVEQLQIAMMNHQDTILAKRDALAANNLRQAAEFLDANREQDGVQETDSGLQYKVIKSGDGESPEPGASVLVHYRGSLIDGTEFDSSYSRDEPTQLNTDQVIPAWQEALPMMKTGDKWELYVHPDLGYGEQGSGGTIGPNEAMIFEVELLSIQQAGSSDDSTN